MKNSKVASRYAKALFAIAVEKNHVDSFNTDLRIVANLFEEEEQLATIFFHPRLSKDEKNGIVDSVFEPLLNSEYTLNFLKLAVAKKREKDIPAICSTWQDLYNVYKRQLPIELVSATEIDQEQLQSILTKVALRTGREPVPTVTIDASILGGMILRYQDKIIDGSVRKQLQQLAASIKAIPVAGLRGE